MPRARRRRRHPASRRSWGRLLLIVVSAALALVVIVGSLIEIPTQSSGYRTSTNTGYGALVSHIVDASNQTGGQLAALMDRAPHIPNQQSPYLAMARTEIEQGLDQAVSSTSAQAALAAQEVGPFPTGDIGARLAQVMIERAKAASDLRATIDQLLGMTPLPIAGAPTPSIPLSSAPLISIDQAASAMAAAGNLFQQADDEYRALTAEIRLHRIPIHLPPSVWVPAPIANAPLGAASLGASASALDASGALVPFHQLVITAVGLTPPAVPSSGIGIVGDSCSAPVSLTPAAVPTVLPPTTAVTAAVTVTNCGNVVEPGVVVTASLAVADPPGTAPPPAGSSGSRTQVAVTLRSASSAALVLGPLAVASGHLYTLTLAIEIPTGQAARPDGPAGSTQQFLLQIAA